MPFFSNSDCSFHSDIIPFVLTALFILLGSSTDYINKLTLVPGSPGPRAKKSQYFLVFSSRNELGA